jgi:hypothetical protein
MLTGQKLNNTFGRQKSNFHNSLTYFESIYAKDFKMTPSRANTSYRPPSPVAVVQSPVPRPTVTKTIQRYDNTNAEVTISSKGVVRNEFVKVRCVYHDGKRLTYQLCPYDAPKYNFVSDILNEMSDDDKSMYLARSYFEIIIDQQSLDTGFQNISHQLSKLNPIFGQIQKLGIKIEIPDGGCPIESYKEYTQTKIFKWFSQLVEILSAFTSLNHLDIVLELPIPIGEEARDYLAGYVMPFYELRGFRRWSIKIQEREVNPGAFPPRFVSKACVQYFNRKHNKLRKEKNSAMKNAIVTRYSASSEDGDVDMTPLLNWANGNGL